MLKEKRPNPFLEKGDEGFVVTAQGITKLKRMFTNPTGQVYACKHQLSPLTAAALMARLSRQPHDMRVCYLNEFAGLRGGKAATNFIERVLTEYGDDSVQQLVGIHLTVESASNLLTKILEWGRLAAELEQSTRYILFDGKVNGRYRYYVPALPDQLRSQYIDTMDRIFTLYSQMVRELTKRLREQNPAPEEPEKRTAWLNSTRATACDAIRPVLPAATQSTVGIYANAQATESLIIHLLANPLAEARNIGQLILEEARKVIGPFLTRTDLPDRGGATTAYMANNRAAMVNLAARYLNPNPGRDAWRPSDDVTLISYEPENEQELVAEMLYAVSDLPLMEIKRQVTKLSTEQILDIFRGYIGNRLNRRHRPGRALEIAHFLWEIIADYGVFRDLQRHRIVDALEWQMLTPLNGFAVPPVVTENGLEEPFRECFQLSESLYSMLRVLGDGTEQYATLLGHRMRHRLMNNLRQNFHLLELRTQADGHPGYRKICMRQHELLTAVYPLMGRAMRFINTKEDPALTRMAAEIATQYKLSKLGVV